MRSVLIGITCGEIFNRDRPNSPMTYGQSFTYVDAIIHAGGIPLLLPITKDTSVARAMYDQLDGVLFAGGNDIDPSFYKQQPHPKLGEISAQRDHFELQLMEWAEQDQKPVLAICRGMQLLNIYRGGTLHQDIASELPHALEHRTDSIDTPMDYAGQQLLLNRNSKLCEILQTTEILANTYHHQAVDRIGEGLRVSARSKDQIIEGIEDASLPFMIGVQCHPESLEAQSVPGWQQLFDAFVSTAATHSTPPMFQTANV